MPKKLVISLIRVSTDEQELERQRRRREKILRQFNLEEYKQIELKVSGTVVEKTREYREAQELLHRSDLSIAGFVVPSIDRWFRYKLLSEIGRYVEPFEQLIEGQNKLVYCNLGALDLRKREDQDKILDAVRYASKEREVIAERLAEGKDIGREDPQAMIDSLPDWVGHPYQENKNENRGDFWYKPFAHDSVRPLYIRFLAGETLYSLKTELGFKTMTSLYHTLRNKWALGIKHRTRHISKKEWDEERNGFRHRGLTKHDNPIEVPTNLANTPLVTQEIFDAVQDKLAVRKVEYNKRKVVATDFLASPLLHCRKCGAATYGRKGQSGRPDTYTCSTRHRSRGRLADVIQNCDEPIYRRIELDKAVTDQFFFFISDWRKIEAKIDESLNQDQRAEAQKKVAQKERTLADLEKKVARCRKAIIDTDDPELPATLKELNREVASARNEVATAKEGVSEVAVIDRATLRAQISRDVLSFHKKPYTEQKSILAKYVKRITAQKLDDAIDEDSGEEYGPRDYHVTFEFKVAVPTLPDPSARKTGGFSSTKSESLSRAS